jgi:hypothetical protein
MKAVFGLVFMLISIEAADNKKESPVTIIKQDNVIEDGGKFHNR